LYIAHVDTFDAGWSSPVARQAHNLKVVGSNPAPAPKVSLMASRLRGFFVMRRTARFQRASANIRHARYKRAIRPCHSQHAYRVSLHSL
jgi:hypothetical protein